MSMYCFPLWESYKVVVRILRESFFLVLKYSVFVLQSMFYAMSKWHAQMTLNIRIK